MIEFDAVVPEILLGALTHITFKSVLREGT